MSFIDKIIGAVSPQMAYKRELFKAKTNAMRRSYDGATKGRRGDGWAGTNTQNQNTDIQASLTTLRARSIDGYKNNSTVFKAIRTIQNNVIGTGIMATPIAKSGDKALTKTEIKKIKQYWEEFIKNCDFDGMFNFYGMQSLGMRTIAMQGEIFVVRQRDASGFVPFKLQVMAPMMCDHSKAGYLLANRPNNYIVQGVEFDERGRKVGYWMHEFNPNNEYVMRVAPKFVPVADVIQVFYKEYPEQVRGIPFGTSAMLNMRDLADYEDAQLMLQKVAACHVAFTTKETDDSSVGVDGNIVEGVDHLEPGLIERLAPGETVTFNNPPTPSSYSEYVSKNQQKNAAGYGITYEQLTGDMGNVNFSSGRMGWIEAQRQIEDWQYNMFIPLFCDGVWKWFIDALIIRGVISREVGVEWTPQGREMIDPVKEMNGLILELKSGLISWTEACKRRGYNPDVLLEQMKADKAMFAEAGIDVEWILKNPDATVPST
jgi:lambda family phage portal protein